MKKNVFMALGIVALVAGMLFSVPVLYRPAGADARSLVGETVVRLDAGTSGYTQTTTSDVATTQYYGTAQIQVHTAVSGTGVITITPQFSNDVGACSSARYWFSAADIMYYPDNTSTSTNTVSVVASSDGTITTTVVLTTSSTTTTTTVTGDLKSDTISYAFSITGGQDGFREFPVQGRCMRVQIASNASVFTPTIFARLVNQQE